MAMQSEGFKVAGVTKCQEMNVKDYRKPGTSSSKLNLHFCDSEFTINRETSPFVFSLSLMTYHKEILKSTKFLHKP